MRSVTRWWVTCRYVRERMFGYPFGRFIETCAGFRILTASTHTAGTTALEGRRSVISPLGEGSEAAWLSILPWRNSCSDLLPCYSLSTFGLDPRRRCEWVSD